MAMAERVLRMVLFALLVAALGLLLANVGYALLGEGARQLPVGYRAQVALFAVVLLLGGAYLEVRARMPG